jgi:hypothetical protein
VNSRDLRLIAIAGAGLALVFAARGAEEGRSGDLAVEDPSAEDAAEPDLAFGSAAAPDAIRTLDFAEIDQVGNTCDAGLEGTVPRKIEVSGGESEVLDEDWFTRLEIDGDVVYGDLNGDGRDEAVVHTVCAYGANGAQDTIQVWSLDSGSAEVSANLGEPPASVSGPLPSTAKEIEVDDDGALVVTWTHYDEDDPSCCPGWESTVRYMVTGSKVTPVGNPVTRPVSA